jgi:hypothetical protein
MLNYLMLHHSNTQTKMMLSKLDQSESESPILKQDAEQDSGINMTLLVGKRAHRKFTAALTRLFTLYSLDLFGHHNPLQKVMPLASFRMFCAHWFPSFDAEAESAQDSAALMRDPYYSRPEPALSDSQLHLFLDFHDLYYKPRAEMHTLSVFYCASPLLTESRAWDYHICLSASAFTSMMIDFALRSPRLVWNLLFALGYNGYLDCTEEYSVVERAFAARGQCLECHKPATTHLTRCSLICACCESAYISDPEDHLFVVC